MAEIKDITTTAKKVALPKVTTYAGAPEPLLISTVTVKQVPQEGFRLGYAVDGFATTDGVYDGTTLAAYYTAFAARNQGTPLTHKVERKILH
ncbi:hypothetical protein [Hymenobacter fodinae]|uniref:Uncharacterized protein n=1 Tax=Hymenobacter fodinae TaxID=2510796 RepID=A0A4Z0P2B1_9BACT|nr:hypothetical protein [Hymenobacter fodinae]TGE05552.1 hypothetical protein EU556_19830 [Hymenobacter fodinae]